MSDYPTTITPDILAKNAGISNGEIYKDIRDTENEIYSIEIEANAYRDISEASLDANERKMASFKESAKRDGIRTRKEFIEFLRTLLKARGELKE
jgi:hypothetical protein